ncbi:MAG: hypothetical protein SPG64_04340, partial [Candidatus Enteromonas sp.]|nr:hypothetical protein [Candidatus Enteromonas sp.]
TGAHFRINGSVINHYKAAGKKTMRVTFGAGQRLIINASVGGAGTQLFHDYVTSLTADASGNYYMDLDLLDETYDWSWGIEVYSYTGNVVIPGIDFLDTEIDRSPSKESYFAFDSSADTVTYSEESGWTASLLSGNHFKLSGSVISYFKDLGKKTLRLTFGHNERYIINVNQNGATTRVWDNYTASMSIGANGDAYMEFDLTDSTIDWTWGIEFFTYGVTGSNPYTIRLKGIDFLDEAIDNSPSKESYFAFDSSADTVAYSEESGWTASLLSGNHFKLSGSVISYFKDLGKSTMRITFGHNERYVININKNGGGVRLWDNYTSAMAADSSGNPYMDLDLTDSTIDWSWGIEFYTWGTTGSNPYTVRILAMDFLD